MRKVVWVCDPGCCFRCGISVSITNYFKDTVFGFDFSGSNSFILVLFGGAIGGTIFI